VAGQTDPWYGDKSQSTLWHENKPAANRLHPTMKPVELIERALVNSSKAGDVVLDLFGGSGSTLIACERKGQLARLPELDPKYADVIVRRWQEYAGKIAMLDGAARSFEEKGIVGSGQRVGSASSSVGSTAGARRNRKLLKTQTWTTMYEDSHPRGRRLKKTCRGEQGRMRNICSIDTTAIQYNSISARRWRKLSDKPMRT
jgi:hypothetical protein